MISRSSSLSSSLKVLVIFALAFVQVETSQSHNSNIDVLCNLTTDQLINFYGYTTEVHKVITQDGYVLTLFRCNSKTSTINQRKPVIVQHGILSSSDEFCQNIPNHSLAYVMADADYDIWLMNARGNFYSRHHVSKNPDDSSSGFWEFSWYEIGIYDNAAVIDYVLAKTNNTKLFYIGYSQGATTLMVLLSERPEYNDKLYASSLLAPIGYLKRLHFLSKYLNFFLPLAQTYQNREMLPRSRSISKVILEICTPNMLICNNLLNILLGPSVNHRNFTMFPSYACHGPSGASFNQFLHYAQEIKYGHFGKYMNNESTIPSDFPLTQITAPVSIHVASSDQLISVRDVEKLTSKMKNVVYVQYINQTKWNHVDFIWDTRAYSTIYSEILKVFQDYQ